MKTKTKLEIVLVGIVIIAIGYIAFSSKTLQVEAQRTVVIDGDLYRASDLFGSKRLSNSKDIRMLFEEKNGKILLGKGQEGVSGSPHDSPSTQLFLSQIDDSKEIMISAESNVRYAFFDNNTENIIYSVTGANLYRYNIQSGKNEKIAKEAISAMLSPDGKNLVYEKAPPGWMPSQDLEGSPGFAILDLNTGKERIIPNTNMLSSTHDDYAPLWTPNGKHILFFGGGIHVINLDGTDRTQLTRVGDGTNAYGISNDPLWSSDGRYFIYHSDYDIMLVELNLKNKHVITAGPIAYGISPKWVEEGKTISVFSPDAKVGAPALSVVDLNGKVLSGDKSREKDYYSLSKGAFRRIAPRPVPPPPPPEPVREIPPGVFKPIPDDTQMQKAIPAGTLKPVTQ